MKTGRSFPSNFAAGLWHLATGSSTRPINSAASTQGVETAMDSAAQPVAQPSAALKLDLAPETRLNHTQPKTHRQTFSVPSGRVARAATFTGMIAKVGWNKAFDPNPEGTILPTSSHEAIVAGLCRMRGAVLKLGQMLSIQDEKTVPPTVTAIFEKVRDQAFVMPEHQLHDQMAATLGNEWRGRFETFSDEPIAAASIGQVHKGEIRTGTDELVPVAVKIQYPGVANSIDSDVANLKMLVTMQLLPAGLFVGNIMRDMQRELKEECQYTIEANKQKLYASLVDQEPHLRPFVNIPKVHEDYCSDSLLVTDFVQGVTIDQIQNLPEATQEFRNHLCTTMMRLTLTELFVWRFMQTDPNFSNFLVNPHEGKVNLLDFGAARHYTPEFVDDYLDVVHAASIRDRDGVINKSIALGFLTGKECKEMLDAHVESVFTLGFPFQPETAGKGYDFGTVNLPQKLQALVPTMLKLRLRPPPLPIYSLHRRISGTILLCTRMGAKIDSAGLFQEVRERAMKERKQRLAAAKQQEAAKN